jgi:uncharacterized protein YecE (DUF72 family)
MSAPVRIGTCAWTDPGLIELWYPEHAKTPEARLRYYAEHFDVVEVNSSYYAIPDRQTSEKWAQRTPDGFVFHVKAFGMMTGHRVSPEQLPADLRPLVSAVTTRGNVQPSEELRRRVFTRFRHALEPLAETDRLGLVLFQYGPSIEEGEAGRELILDAAERMDPYRMAVEFRHRSWVRDPETTERTLEFLRAHGLTHVAVDAPRAEAPTAMPMVADRTSDTSYIRFHGRNAGSWGRSGGPASERFDWFYEPSELEEWVEPLRVLSAGAARSYAMFNTNSADQGPVNAGILRSVLEEAGVDVADEPDPLQDTLF